MEKPKHHYLKRKLKSYFKSKGIVYYQSGTMLITRDSRFGDFKIQFLDEYILLTRLNKDKLRFELRANSVKMLLYKMLKIGLLK